MKKFMTVVIALFVFLLVGCEKNNEIDLSNNSSIKSQVNDEELYGKVIHAGQLAKRMLVKNVKLDENTYAFVIAFENAAKERSSVALICDLRLNGAIVTYHIKDNEGNLAQGNDYEISIMKYRPNVRDIRESDENQDPVFSTANNETDFLGGVRKAAMLPKNTVLAFTVDRPDAKGNYNAVAWSPLFTAGDLLSNLPDGPSKCLGYMLDMNDVHVVAAQRP